MKNLIHRPVTRFGLPFHGLVTDGELTTPGGPLAVSHVASVEGAIGFKTRNPPGNNPDAAQAALDTAQGWDWRDYAILNSQFRAIGDGLTQLGELNWLYCDLNDVVWDMQLQLVANQPASGQLSVQVWKMQPFGRFYFGFDRTHTPELVGTWVIDCPIAEWEDSGTISLSAAQVAAFAEVRGAGIVPSIHGDEVYIHVLSPYTLAYPETVAYYSLIKRACFAIGKFTITGEGDLNDGTGDITATISDVLVYPWFSYQGEFDNAADTIDPWPINHISNTYNNQCIGSGNNPTGPGQNCTEDCDAVFTHQGTVFSPRTKSSTFGDRNLKNEIKWTLPFPAFKFHGGDIELEIKQIQLDDTGGGNTYQIWGQGGFPEMKWDADYVSAWDGNSWYWDLVSQTRVCSAWTKGTGDTTVYNGYSVDVNGNLDNIEMTKNDTSEVHQILGVGTASLCGCISWTSDDGFPDPSSTFNRVYTWTEPYTVDDAYAGVYCDGPEQKITPLIFPGIIGYVTEFGLPGLTTVRHRGKLWGIGNDNTLTLITTWDVTEVDLTIRFPWTSVAWEPETKQFNVQTDGSTLVKYI